MYVKNRILCMSDKKSIFLLNFIKDDKGPLSNAISTKLDEYFVKMESERERGEREDK